VLRKRSELRLNDWILHHDSAAAHKAISVKQPLSAFCVLYNSLQNILTHYSFSSVMYFKEKTKSVKIRITVRESKLNCVNKDWLLYTSYTHGQICIE